MIHNLTNDMTRLCGEIAGLRDSRAALRSNLAQGRDDLKDGVSRLRADLRTAHQEMTAKTTAELQDFVAKVKDTVANVSQRVAAFREETLGDVAGAHRAWCGNVSEPAPSRMAAAGHPTDFAPKAKKKKR